MTALQSAAQKELQRIVDQIERLDSERKALSADISDKFKEAKSKGYDAKILRKVLALRKMDDAERAEQEAIIATYCHALGMAGTPLDDYAEKVAKIGKAHGMPKSVRDSVIADGPG